MSEHINRLNTITKSITTNPEWRSVQATAYGIVVTSGMSMTTFRMLNESGRRDGLYFLTERVLVVSPKESPGFGAIWSGLMGNALAAAKKSAETTELRRGDISEIERHQVAPRGWILVGAEFLSVKARTGREILIWIDPSTSNMNRVDGMVEGYL